MTIYSSHIYYHEVEVKSISVTLTVLGELKCLSCGVKCINAVGVL